MAIKVLQVVTSMSRGGLETMIMNYYRNIDRDKIQFDFLVHRDFKADYDDEIKSLGGNIYYLPAISPKNLVEYKKRADEFFTVHNDYDIVHSHIDSLSSLPLYFAKKHGVKVRIAHSHNTRFDKNKKLPLRLFSRSIMKNFANYYFACGSDAGKFMFGENIINNKNFYLIKNVIDTDKFTFNENTRNSKRKELNIADDTLVIGHIGRFTWQKNHVRVLEIFKSLLEKNENSILVLVGTGELVDEIKTKAKELGIENNIKFLGTRTDTSQLYSAFDVFLLPSHYEGLPVVGIEAQSTGLPCVFASTITKEGAVLPSVSFVNLDDSNDIWADALIKASKLSREGASEIFKKDGYDAKSASVNLENIYFNLIK